MSQSHFQEKQVISSRSKLWFFISKQLAWQNSKTFLLDTIISSHCMKRVKMLGLSLSSKLDPLSSCFCSIAKTASKKIEALVCSMTFLSPEVALYLYKSAIQACMKYCCLVWAGACSYYLDMWNKLQKQVCRTAGPLLAASLEPLAHHWNVASISFICRYYFGR